MTPRNEFEGHDKLEGLTDLQIQDMLKLGRITVNDVRRHRGLAELPGEGESSSESEVKPVEVDPHMWPDATRDTLAELRKTPGLSTTKAHIAERYESGESALY